MGIRSETAAEGGEVKAREKSLGTDCRDRPPFSKEALKTPASPTTSVSTKFPQLQSDKNIEESAILSFLGKHLLSAGQKIEECLGMINSVEFLREILAMHTTYIDSIVPTLAVTSYET